MSARQGQCPTCGNNIAIPVLDRFGRTIDPDTHQIIKPDPHPVHAYAAAGERAPKILRQGDDRAIQCPRCFAISPIDADNCNRCAMPFTIEGTCARDSGGDNGLCVASLILGVIGLPAMCFVVPSLLAIVFGVAGLIQIDRGGRTTGRGAAIAGIITGAAGLLMFAAFLLR